MPAAISPTLISLSSAAHSPPFLLFPLPSNHHQQLTNTILDIVQQAANYKQLRKGANEGEDSCCQEAAARKKS